MDKRTERFTNTLAFVQAELDQCQAHLDERIPLIRHLRTIPPESVAQQELLQLLAVQYYNGWLLRTGRAMLVTAGAQDEAPS